MPTNRTAQALAKLADLTPRQIVGELDRYIVGQADAKKAVAIALRNRWRRQRTPDAIREEISPNNIILIGPTGVGKTEIARRLAKLAGAPFIKVEASKFTEVGYVGRDVESMVRDLVESAIDMTPNAPMIDVLASQGTPDGMENFGEMLREMLPKRKKKRIVKISEARRILFEQELDKLIDVEDVTTDALERVEKLGIIFLDEIDKIAGERSQMGGPDVSREGVQRDLLPIVEGSNVQTKYGMVKTDHVLFIAAGAFHVSKPSDLIPELQGRFPIRVTLKPLV